MAPQFKALKFMFRKFCKINKYKYKIGTSVLLDLAQFHTSNFNVKTDKWDSCTVSGKVSIARNSLYVTAFVSVSDCTVVTQLFKVKCKPFCTYFQMAFP